MEISLVIIFLGLLIFFTHFLNSIFDRTKIPNALLLLVVGLLIGPVAGLIKPGQFGEIGPVFTGITLIILLFESGVNLDIRSIGKAIGSATMLTLFNFVFSASLAAAIAFYFTSIDSWLSASFFGVIIGGTSAAIVIPIIKQLKMNKSGETILLLESALSDVLCLVVGLGILSAMEKGDFQMNALAINIGLSFSLAALIGLVIGLIWSVVLYRVRKLHDYTFTNLAAVFIVSGVTDLLGLNGGIATLVFGITLGNAHLLRLTRWGDIFESEELLESEKNFFSEIVFILQTYFFVYVGVSIKFGNAIIFLIGLLIVITILLFRPISIRLFVRKKMPFKDLSIMSAMTPKGLVPAILASLPLQMGIANGGVIQDLSYAVVLFSILLVALLVIIFSKNPYSSPLNRILLLSRSEEHEEKNQIVSKEEITNKKAPD